MFVGEGVYHGGVDAPTSDGCEVKASDSITRMPRERCMDGSTNKAAY